MKNPIGIIPIKGIIIIMFVLIMLTMTLGIGSLVFNRWRTTAEETTEQIAKSISNNIYDQVVTLIHVPEHINEVNHKIIENGILNLSDEVVREKFFVGVLQAQEDEVYSFSFGTVNGEYYGARRNSDNIIEIMRNNTETDGNSWYYAVKEDLTAGELVVQAGLFDPRTRAWFQAAVETDGPIFSPIYKHFIMDDLTVSSARPVYNSAGELQGVIGTHMLLSGIGTVLEDATREYNGYAVIVEKDTGALVANSMGEKNFALLEDGNLDRYSIRDLVNNDIRQAYENHFQTNGSYSIFEGEEEKLFVAIREIKASGIDWVVISAIPESLYLINVIQSIRLTAILVVIALIFSIILYYVIIGKFLRPMKNLLQTSEEISSGDLSKRVEVIRKDEIGIISESVNNIATKMQFLINNLEASVEERTKDLHKANAALEDNKDHLQLILDSTAEGIYGVDLDGISKFCNISCVKLLGYQSQDELLGKNMHDQIHHSRRDGTMIMLDDCKIIRAINRGRGVDVDDEVFWKADGTFIDVEYHSYPQIKNGEVVGGVVTFLDITERKQVEDRVKYLSYHDSVTGLYNRSFVYEELNRLDVERNLPFSIIVGDINGLKLTNDIFGHEVGDILLKKISAAIKKTCRADDISARIGGDEFLILLPRTGAEDADATAKRIQDNVEKVGYKAIKGSIALGRATKLKTSDDFAVLFKDAEEAMYINKSILYKDYSNQQLKRIVNSLHFKSEREKLHAQNVSKLSGKIALQLGLPAEEVRRIKDAGYYHDIGKVILNDDILKKVGRLDEDERLEMKKHATAGYRILNLFNDTMDVAGGALQHHEHWDGTGYPKGLKEEEISITARIIAVAECYDFRTNKYSIAKLSKEEAIEEIKACAGWKYDPLVVRAFVEIMDRGDL